MQCLTNEIIFCGFRKHSRSGLQLHTGLQLIQRSDCRAADLAVFRRRKAFLLCKNPCGGTAVGMGSPPQSAAAPPAQRNFQRKFALRRVGSARFVVPRLAITQKYVTTLDKRILNTGQPRGARGTAVPLFREESRGTPSKGFLWATSSRRLDTALLCAAKKRGVETTRLAGHCQLKLAPAATDGSKKPPAAALGSKNKKRRAAFAAPKPYSYRGTMIFTAR